MKLTGIYRYPVKGLGPESLNGIALQPGQCIPADRRFALAHGRSEFDAAEPGWVQRNNFVVVAHSPRLTCLRCRFEEEGQLLTVEFADERTLVLDLSSTEGRRSLAAAIADYAGKTQSGSYSVVEAPGVNLTDSPTRTVSVFNQSSLNELATEFGGPIDKRRFRGNLWIDGFPPWEELEWVGRDIEIGDSVLRVTEPIERCAATNANPDNGERDMNIPGTLRRRYGHVDFGVLAEVRKGGPVAVGDRVKIL